jgi:hypothetical protein
MPFSKMFQTCVTDSAARRPIVRQPRPEDEDVSNHKEWSITCRDVAGRRRDLTVFVRQGRVVLVAPPGETAVLAPLDVGRLRAALRDAVVDASKTED